VFFSIHFLGAVVSPRLARQCLLFFFALMSGGREKIGFC
jgi:hypothetical protein